MTRIKAVFIVYFLLFSKFCISQAVEIKGVVRASSDGEGIHVINKTSEFLKEKLFQYKLNHQTKD